jgi:hypothetical protein
LRFIPRDIKWLRKRQELGATMEEELRQIARKAGQTNSGSWRKAGQLPLEEAKRAARSEHLSAQPLDAEAERKRQELAAAMEEELHQIVTKAGQANSSSWRKVDQLPRDEAKRAALSRRSSWPWIMSLAVSILALSTGGYHALKRSQVAELKPAAESLAGLGLKVEMRKNLVHISWDKNTPLIASAKRGVLSVKDGPFQNDLTLGAELLLRGSVNYYHKTGDVMFHLQIVTNDSKTTSEVVQMASANHANTRLPTPVSIDLYPRRAGPGALLDNSKGTGSRAPAVRPEGPSDRGKIEGVIGSVPQEPGKTARHSPPQLSLAISAQPLQRRTPAPTETNTPTLTALNSAKPEVPQTWKLMVEYLGLTPLVSAEAGVPLSSSSPLMELPPREEKAEAVQSQPMAPPSDEPAPSPKEQANNVSLAQETPLPVAAVPTADSVLQLPAIAPPQAKANGSAFSSIVQCPENVNVREIPFVSGRPDRKTVACGEGVAIIGEFGDWVRIRTWDGFEGHILRRFVK